MRVIDADALNESIRGISKNITRPAAVELMCLFQIEEAPTIETPRWISLDERLPTKEDSDKDEHILGFTKDGFMGCWNWEDVARFCREDFTHWMPMPEPPKDGGM